MGLHKYNRSWLTPVLATLLLACGYGLGLLSSSAVFRHKELVQAIVKPLIKLPAGRFNDSYGMPGATGPAAVRLSTTGSSPTTTGGVTFVGQLPISGAGNESLAACATEVPAPKLLIQQSQNAIIAHSELDHVGLEGPTACSKGAARGLRLPLGDVLVAPVVILGHNRVQYLARCMMVLVSYWSKDPANSARFPLFISIDGGDQRALNFAAAWKEAAQVQVITRAHDLQNCNNGDCHLTAHFRMLLQLFFQCQQAPRAVFLEEDLEVSPDFLNYFAATAPLLSQDPSLWCVSAWNDHGQQGRAVNATALYRTDIFPGLGWMMTKEHALPLLDKWPERYWDDWMREPKIRKNRQCIFPEVSRTYHFGKVGTHMYGTFFDKFLAKIRLNSEDVQWKNQDLAYLSQSNYAATMRKWLSEATPYNNSQLGMVSSYCDSNKPPDTNDTTDLVVTYVPDPKGFEVVAQQLPGVMGDFRGQRPRCSCNGTVIVRCRGRRLFLQPSLAVPEPSST